MNEPSLKLLTDYYLKKERGWMDKGGGERGMMLGLDL